MGNVWFGKRRRSKGESKEQHDGIVARLKVRMSRGQLEELMKKVEIVSKGDSSKLMGGLIFQECLKGRLRARLVAASSGKGSEFSAIFKYAKGWGLSPIQEHERIK